MFAEFRQMANKSTTSRKAKPDRGQKLSPDDPILVKLRKLRDSMNLKQEDFAESASTSVSYISRLETGKTVPTLTDLRHFSALLGVPIAHLVSDDEDVTTFGGSRPRKISVEGEVAAGRYIEFVQGVRVDFERYESPFPPDPNYPIAAQFDLRVSGSSLNRFARDGEFLRCVHLIKSEMLKHPVQISDGDYVIFERSQGQLIEVTAKKLVRRGSNIELWPDSDDEQWQTPTILPAEGADEEEGRVVALVLYAYRPTRKR